MSLFTGYPDAHGVYEVSGEADSSGKMRGKAKTVKGHVSIELWSEHLLGRRGIGIMPIMPNNCVRFAAIDIDEYPLDLKKLSARVLELKLPLIVCRTKSGGAHLYLFLKEDVSAEIVLNRMREFAAALGRGNCEIFPRQTKILAERGDLGNWINMPYFNAEESLRFAYGPQNIPIGIVQFVKYAQEMQHTRESLEQVSITLASDALPGGPPCLQFLVHQGFPRGTRNMGLFNLGVYARKAYPDDWERALEGFNSRYMDPPMTNEEVGVVIKSLNKKDYLYTCKASPIQQHCNTAICRTCKHGIGGISPGLPKTGTLTKLNTDPAVWFLEIDGGGRMELSTNELQNFNYFQNACMEKMNLMPPMIKRQNWEEIVRGLLETLIVIEVPVDATPVGQFGLHLEDFCTSRVQGKSHDELLLGKPWTSNGKTYFRIGDLIKYLERQGFKELRKNQVVVNLRDKFRAEHTFFNIKGKGLNVWYVPEFQVKVEKLDAPEQQDEAPM